MNHAIKHDSFHELVGKWSISELVEETESAILLTLIAHDSTIILWEELCLISFEGSDVSQGQEDGKGGAFG